MKKIFVSLVCLGFGILSILGCQQYTTVDLRDPHGASLSFEGGSYVFPTRIHIPRPEDLEDSYQTRVSLSLPTSQGLRTFSGIMEVYGTKVHEVDELNPYVFRFLPDDIARLESGQAVEYKAESASGYRLFQLLLQP
jgi:hypothetical protein